MTVDDYKYVEGKPTKYPLWGKELAEQKLKNMTRLWITSSYFKVSHEHTAGMLCGIRSIWEIDDDQMKAKIVSIQTWEASDTTWHEIDHDYGKVSAGHRAVLAGFLMSRWAKGKLRGRITDVL